VLKASSTECSDLPAPSGKGKAVVIPLGSLNPAFAADCIAVNGEKFLKNDPKKAADVASDALLQSDESKQGYDLMGQACEMLNLYREAVNSYMSAAVLENEEEKIKKRAPQIAKAAENLYKMLPPTEVTCKWGPFNIHVPKTWEEISLLDVDSSVAQMYVSKPLEYLKGENNVELMYICELKERPDFSCFVDAMKNESLDGEVKAGLYTSAIPDIIWGLNYPHVLTMRFEHSSTALIIRAKVCGVVNGKGFYFYHCFILPEPFLLLGKAALFLMISCRDFNSIWMDQWSDDIFNRSLSIEKIPSKDTPYMNLTSPHPSEMMIFEDQLAYALELSKLITQSQDLLDVIRLTEEEKELEQALQASKQDLNDEDAQLAQAIAESMSDSYNPRTMKTLSTAPKINFPSNDDYDSDLEKALRLSEEEAKKYSKKNEFNNELQTALELSRLDALEQDEINRAIIESLKK
jgi:hypothetical protein